LQCFVQINTKECKNAAELVSRIQISKLPGMDSGVLVAFAFATMVGGYPSTFSFSSKDIYYKLNDELN